MEINRLLFIATLLLLINPLQAADKTPEWAKLLSIAETSSFSYQETRHLEFLDQPWQGAGILIASKDGTLVKHQLRPQRKIMAISPGEMIYFDSSNAERHRMPLSFSHPMTEQARVFQGLLQGNTALLNQDYNVRFSSTKQGWELNLLPKNQHQKTLFKSIAMQGDADSGSRTIILHQTSGDSSELNMQLLDQDQALEFTIERLLQEAIGR